MILTIQNSQEALSVVQALLIYTKASLTRAGYLTPRTDEDEYYTQQRELLHALEKFVERSSV